MIGPQFTQLTSEKMLLVIKFIKLDGRPWRQEPEAELTSVEYEQAFVAEGRMIIDFK